jgi:hypothetical protein
MVGIALLVGGILVANSVLQKAPPTAPPATSQPTDTSPAPAETLPEYIQQYENRQPPVRKSSGEWVHLSNNVGAKDVSFAELRSFILEDDTDEGTYFETVRICGDFAEQLHNNAERAGIKAAFVGVNFVGEEIGHALNAFKTTDRGLVYIDCTGMTAYLKLKSFMKQDKNKPQYDTVAYIEKGKQYGTINIDKAESLDYGFYVEYAQNCQKMVDDFRNEADAFNRALDRALGGRTTLAEPEYSKFKAWEAELIKKERTLDELGLFKPLGIIETVKIYW